MAKHIGIQDALDRFAHARDCAEYAPDRTYEITKKVLRITGDHMDTMMREFKSLGIIVDNCDLAYAVEACLYYWASATGSSGLAVGEGFGRAMGTEAKDRVIAGAIRDRDALNKLRREIGS